MDSFDQFDASANTWAAQMWVTMETNLREMLGSIDPFWVGTALVLVATFVSITVMFKRRMDALDNNEDDEEDEGEPLVGMLECFDAGGKKIDGKDVFSEEPDWDYDENGEGLLTRVSTKEGDSEDTEIGADEFAVFRANSPDEDCDADELWIVSVVGTSGETIFKEIVRDDDRPDSGDNYVRVWSRDGRQLSVYCGSALAITAVPYKETLETFGTAAK